MLLRRGLADCTGTCTLGRRRRVDHGDNSQEDGKCGMKRDHGELVLPVVTERALFGRRRNLHTAHPTGLRFRWAGHLLAPGL